MEMSTKVEQLSQENAWYKEQVKFQQKKLFGKSSEKTNTEQISLFDEAEVESTPISDESEIIKVPEHKRKKKGKPLSYDNIPVETIHYELSGKELICPTCGDEYHEMSTKVKRELVYVPPKIEVKEHVEHIYSCRNCEKNGIEATIATAKGPKPLIAGSMASPSAVANIINDKYNKSVPLYRQEITFKQLGINLSRQTMSNWLIKCSNIYFLKMIDLMKKELVAMDIIRADETKVEVLHEPGKKASALSYMWVYASGRSESKQLVIFKYEASRAHNHAIKYLKEFSGTLQSDGYQAYDKIENIRQAGCWAHCRRKFTDALALVPKKVDPKTTETYKCLEMINKLFEIEKKQKDTDYDRITKIRQSESLPVVNMFFEKIHELEKISLPKSHLGEAVSYASNQENKLRTYLDDGRIEISNNSTERSIRPFTIGRKNWLFMNTVKGANSSSAIYSLIESAKMNNLKPYDYINYVLEKAPLIDFNDENQISQLMPYSKLPKNLYNPKKS